LDKETLEKKLKIENFFFKKREQYLVNIKPQLNGFLLNSFVKDDNLNMDVNKKNIPMPRVQMIRQQYPRYFAINSLK
jgi:hypothetical protein